MNQLSSVLLVDDNPTTNFLNEYLLNSFEVANHVLVAQNGEEALSLLEKFCTPDGELCPVLILLDINMPVMNGINFLEAYRPIPVVPPIIIVLTTSVHPLDLERLRMLPIHEVVKKPLTKEKIDSILTKYFNDGIRRL